MGAYTPPAPMLFPQFEENKPITQWRWALAAIFCVAVCGCSTTPPSGRVDTGVAVPAAWSGSLPVPGATAPLAQWWLQFGDPRMAELIAQALRSNTRVQTAQASLRQARALRDVAAAGLLPSVGSSASAQRSTANRSTGNRFQLGLDAQWELDFFGLNRSALDASSATARASAASLGDVQVSIAAEVAIHYILLRSTQARWRIARDNLDSQQETLQITQWRQQAGLVSALEAEQALAAAEQTRALLPALQTTIGQTGHALAVLTGQPPAALSALWATPGPVPQAAGALTLAIPAETLRQRADVRAAEHQVVAAVARVAQAEAARAPRFTLGGSLGLGAATVGALGSGAAVVGALLGSVALPLVDGGAARAQVRVQQAGQAQAEVAYRATVLAALQEVEDALAALAGDRDRLLRLQSAAVAAGNADLLARQRYSSGLVDFQTVLQTQRTQLATQDSVASASADLGADHVRLYKALGGGWLPTTPDTPNETLFP